MADAESTANNSVIGKPFPPGQSGNPAGRPKGSRNKLGEDFIAALYADFKENGAVAIADVRRDKPDAYLKVIASLLPAQLNINVNNDLSDADLDERIRFLASSLGIEVRTAGPPVGKAEAISH